MAKEVSKENNENEEKDVKKAKNSKQTAKKSTKKETKNSFFKEFKAELKRVSWPTFKQLVNNTTAVLAIVILVAVIVFVLDVIFENLTNFGVEKLKATIKSNSSESVETEDNSTTSGSLDSLIEEGTTESGVTTTIEQPVDLTNAQPEEATQTGEDANSSVEGNN